MFTALDIEDIGVAIRNALSLNIVNMYPIFDVGFPQTHQKERTNQAEKQNLILESL
jgi:hypothetical protein